MGGETFGKGINSPGKLFLPLWTVVTCLRKTKHTPASSNMPCIRKFFYEDWMVGLTCSPIWFYTVLITWDIFRISTFKMEKWRGATSLMFMFYSGSQWLVRLRSPGQRFDLSKKPPGVINEWQRGKKPKGDIQIVCRAIYKFLWGFFVKLSISKDCTTLTPRTSLFPPSSCEAGPTHTVMRASIATSLCHYLIYSLI